MSCRRRSFPKGCAGFPHSLTVAEPLRSDTTTRSTTRKSRCLRRRSRRLHLHITSMLCFANAVMPLRRIYLYSAYQPTHIIRSHFTFTSPPFTYTWIGQGLNVPD